MANRNRPVSVMDPSETGERILIIAPHPDDECLGTAGIIRYSLERGCRILIVIVTSGDGSLKACERVNHSESLKPEMYRKVGILRCNESKRAMMMLGVPRKNIIFLGFPDGSVNSLWDTNWDMNRLHTGLNGYNHSPFGFSYQRRVPYCGKELKENIKEIIMSFKPTSIFYPDPDDSHHDHWAVNAFVQYALIETGHKAKEFLYLVHMKDFPFPHGYAPYHGLFPPPNLMQRGGKWLVFHLNPETIIMKEKITRIYAIPMAIIPELLTSFIRRNELFAVPVFCERQKKGRKETTRLDRSCMAVKIDPAGDTFLGYRKSGDIRKLSLLKKKQAIQLRLELFGRPSQDFIYRMHLRIFTKKKIRRLDIKVSGRDCQVETLASNSIKPEEISGIIRGKVIEVKLPRNVVDSAFCLLAGADVSLNGHMYDRCAWERVLIE